MPKESLTDDVIGWLKGGRAIFVRRVEMIESGSMKTGEKRLGKGDVDTTAETLADAKRKIQEIDALIERHRNRR